MNFATAGQKDVFTVDEEQRRCSVRRTEAMDATIDLVRTQCNLLPLDLPPGYSEHMQAPVRFVEKDEMDRVSVGYKSIGSDDFFMAETYDLIATELWRYRMKLDRTAQRGDHDLGRDTARVPAQLSQRPRLLPPWSAPGRLKILIEKGRKTSVRARTPLMSQTAAKRLNQAVCMLEFHS